MIMARIMRLPEGRTAEGKEVEKEQRIDLLLRVAQIWETKKQKPERAARAYERILEVFKAHNHTPAVL